MDWFYGLVWWCLEFLFSSEKIEDISAALLLGGHWCSTQGGRQRALVSQEAGALGEQGEEN